MTKPEVIVRIRGDEIGISVGTDLYFEEHWTNLEMLAAMRHRRPLSLWIENTFSARSRSLAQAAIREIRMASYRKDVKQHGNTL